MKGSLPRTLCSSWRFVATPWMSNALTPTSVRPMACSRVDPVPMTLASNGIEVRRHPLTFRVARLDAHAHEVGWSMDRQPARGGQQPLGVLGVDPRLDGVAFRDDVVRHHLAKRFVGSDADLGLNKIEAGDGLGDAVFDLQPRVHLQEAELAVGVQGLDRTEAVVAGRGRPSPRLRSRRAGTGRVRVPGPPR